MDILISCKGCGPVSQRYHVRMKVNIANRQRVLWQLVQVDIEWYSYAGVSRRKDKETDFTDSDNSSSCPSCCSYADIVWSRSPSSKKTKLEHLEKLPLIQICRCHCLKVNFMECSVCQRKCVSKSLHSHLVRMMTMTVMCSPWRLRRPALCA